ncbi:MAG: molybdopterin-guanine dinucleotide biosynthesis protein B [Gammaproteobacteria bacterium]|nr:molybdopterin-guanine dinucleotide biosynthesis protein B [Gammaproteobacteria bacterium]
MMNIQNCPTPLIGFCAFSGTGKTTLLTKLIPILSNQGIRLGVIKHAHHNFDVDHAEKDSYKLRHAGATQMIISSSRRWALMTELHENESELALPDLIEQIDHKNIDLILVEGFKNVSFPKIELHRPSLGHPIMCIEDPNIIAFATDQVCEVSKEVICLDINEPKEIATFIRSHFKLS